MPRCLVSNIAWLLITTGDVLRVRMLCIATLVYAISVIGTGAAKSYWMLIVMRMVLAAGEAACNPLSTGILSDIFPEKARGLVMSVFNWGIFGGYGLAFPVGRYVTPMNLFNVVSISPRSLSLFSFCFTLDSVS